MLIIGVLELINKFLLIYNEISEDKFWVENPNKKIYRKNERFSSIFNIDWGDCWYEEKSIENKF